MDAEIKEFKTGQNQNPLETTVLHVIVIQKNQPQIKCEKSRNQNINNDEEEQDSKEFENTKTKDEILKWDQ